MAISTVTNTPSTTSTGSATTTGASLTGTSAADQQDRFMKLLVAQMKNQDPLNPMDNAQMTSQIAQINTVNGIEKLNTTVSSLLSAFNNMQAQSAATQLPGRGVLVDGNRLTLGTNGAMGGVDLSAAADTVSVDIVDASGAVVRTLSLGQSPAGVRSFTWDGLATDGTAAAAGNYLIRASATAGGKAVPVSTLAASLVQAVSNGANGAQVDLGAGGVHAYSDIKSFL